MELLLGIIAVGVLIIALRGDGSRDVVKKLDEVKDAIENIRSEIVEYITPADEDLS